MSEAVNATPAAGQTAPSGAPESTPQANPTTEDKGSKPLTAAELIELKINGQSRKLTTEQLKQYASLGFAANERFQKASEIEKGAKAFDEELQKDTVKALLKKGYTKEQLRDHFEKWYKQEFIDPETMDPRELELQRLKQEKAEREARDKEEAERKQKQEEENETNEHIKLLQKQIIETLEGSNLTKTRFNASRIAYWMKRNAEGGYNAPNEVVVQQVKDERQRIVQEEFNEATPEQMVEMLGENLIKKLRQYDLQLLKKKYSQTSDGTEIKDPGEGKPKRRQERKTMADVDAYLNEMRRMPVQRRD